MATKQKSWTEHFHTVRDVVIFIGTLCAIYLGAMYLSKAEAEKKYVPREIYEKDFQHIQEYITEIRMLQQQGNSMLKEAIIENEVRKRTEEIEMMLKRSKDTE